MINLFVVTAVAMAIMEYPKYVILLYINILTMVSQAETMQTRSWTKKSRTFVKSTFLSRFGGIIVKVCASKQEIGL